MLRELRQVLGVAYMESRWIKRQPLWIVQGFVASAGIMAIMFAWGGSEGLRNVAVAYMVIGAWSQGLNVVAQDIGWSRQGGELERLVASPVTLPIYFLGVALGTSPFMLPTLLPAFVLAFIVGIEVLSLLSLLALIPVSLILGAFTSLSIVLRIKSPTNISAITNPLSTMTTILPPIYYPVGALPPVLREISMGIPTVPLMEVARWITGIRWAYGPAVSFGLLLAWGLMTSILVTKKFKWGME